MRARLQSRWSPAQEPAVVASSPDRSTGVWDQTVDLVVLGTGAARLSAARTPELAPFDARELEPTVRSCNHYAVTGTDPNFQKGEQMFGHAGDDQTPTGPTHQQTEGSS